MSGHSTFDGIFLFFLIITALAMVVWAAVGVPALMTARRRSLQALSQGARWQAAYRKNTDAVDAVIAELEGSRATYETFPQSVRELLDAAHAAAAEVRG